MNWNLFALVFVLVIACIALCIINPFTDGTGEDISNTVQNSINGNTNWQY